MLVNGANEKLDAHDVRNLMTIALNRFTRCQKHCKEPSRQRSRVLTKCTEPVQQMRRSLLPERSCSWNKYRLPQTPDVRFVAKTRFGAVGFSAPFRVTVKKQFVPQVLITSLPFSSFVHETELQICCRRGCGGFMQHP